MVRSLVAVIVGKLEMTVGTYIQKYMYLDILYLPVLLYSNPSYPFLFLIHHKYSNVENACSNQNNGGNPTDNVKDIGNGSW